MERRTIVVAVLISICIFLISFFLGTKTAYYLIGAFCITQGILILTSPKNLKVLERFINKERFESVLEKDDEFKKHIRKSAPAYIIIGIVIFYIGYKFSKYTGLDMKIRFSVSSALLVLVYFLGETNSIKKSKNIDEYRRSNMKLSFVLLIIAAIII